MSQDEQKPELPEWARRSEQQEVSRKRAKPMDEQEVITMLRNLPIAITITPLEDGGYSYQFLEQNGKASSCLQVIELALRDFIFQYLGMEKYIADLQQQHSETQDRKGNGHL